MAPLLRKNRKKWLLFKEKISPLLGGRWGISCYSLKPCRRRLLLSQGGPAVAKNRSKSLSKNRSTLKKNSSSLKGALGDPLL